MLAQKSIYILSVPRITIIGASRRLRVLALGLSFTLALEVTLTIAFKVTLTMAFVGLVLPFYVSFRGHSRARGRGMALAGRHGLRRDLGIPWSAQIGDPCVIASGQVGAGGRRGFRHPWIKKIVWQTATAALSLATQAEEEAVAPTSAAAARPSDRTRQGTSAHAQNPANAAAEVAPVV
jgi:hypothetical protein